MNLKNLILTPTRDMSREEWLAFRQPMTHVLNFIDAWYRAKSNPNRDWKQEVQDKVEFLKYLFATDAWKEFQFPCIGASEVASVVGLSPYKSVIELFYEKIGLKNELFEGNAATFWGQTLEATIAEKWQYWEGTEESLLNNCAIDRIVRRCRRMNAYVQNRAFPWLFASLDRVINKTVLKDEEGALECKTISGFSAAQWENEIPPMHVVQIQQQCLVTELNFGELAILKDGRYFDVLPFDRHDAICEKILRESRHFFDQVKKGIENYLLWSYSQDENYMAEIDRLSPEPDGSLSYKTFLSEQYKDRGGECLGGPVELHLAYTYSLCNKKIKEWETLQIEASNKMKHFMKENSVLDLGAEGKATWKANAKGSRVFNCKVACPDDFKPDPEILKTYEQSLTVEVS